MKVWLIDLELLETRYTHVENACSRTTAIHGFEVEVIEGAEDIPIATTLGAFLNFGGTNIYNPTQIEKCLASGIY